MREAVDNLVDNALRFAPPGTPIVLTASAVGRDLVWRSATTAPASRRTTCRTPSSASGARTRAGLAPTAEPGLGLAIVSAIARAHGGRATAANRPGGGAVVTLELPGAIRP